MSDTSAAPVAAQGEVPGQVGGIGADKAEAAPPAPKTIRIKNAEFKSEDDAYAEIERGRRANQMLSEAQRRLHESSKKEKDWENLRSEVRTKKDARKVIEQLGLSQEEATEVFGRWLYETEVVAKEMSPEQRRIKELEAQMAKFNEEKENTVKQKKKEEFEAAAKQAETQLRKELTELLQNKKVPSTRLALRRLANYMASYAQVGADIPASQAADLVMADYRQEVGELFDEASADQLVEFLGKQRWMALAKKVSDWALNRNKPAQGEPITPPQTAQFRPKTEVKSDKMTPQEFQKFLRSVK